MRILIVSDTYSPAPNSCARMLQELGTELRAMGHEVTVLTADSSQNSSRDISDENGIRVLRVRTQPAKSMGKVRRALVEFGLSTTYWRQAGSFLRSHCCDLIVYYSPSIFLAPLVQRLKLMWSCRVYLVLRDVFPDWARDTGVLGGGPAYWYLRRRARQQFRIADNIGVETPSSVGYFNSRYPGHERRVEVLMNWTRREQADGHYRSFRASLGLENKVIFVYGGNIGLAQGVGNLIRLASRMQQHPTVHFLLVGRGSEVPVIETLVKNGEAPNVTLLPETSESAYMALLRECDVGFINLNGRLRTHNVPGKLLGYVRAGLPVLASLNRFNDLHDLIRSAGIGLASVTGDDDALAENAIKLALSAELRTTMGRNTTQALETHFSVARAARQVLGSAETTRPGSTAHVICSSR